MPSRPVVNAAPGFAFRCDPDRVARRPGVLLKRGSELDRCLRWRFTRLPMAIDSGGDDGCTRKLRARVVGLETLTARKVDRRR